MPYLGKNFDPNKASHGPPPGGPPPAAAAAPPPGSGYQGKNYDPSRDKSLQRSLNPGQSTVPQPFTYQQPGNPFAGQQTAVQQQQFASQGGFQNQNQLPFQPQQPKQTIAPRDEFTIIEDELPQIGNFIFNVSGCLVVVGQDMVMMFKKAEQEKFDKEKPFVKQQIKYKIIKEDKLSHPTELNLPFFVFDAKLADGILFIASNFGVYYLIINVDKIKQSNSALPFSLVYPARTKEAQVKEGTVFRNLSVVKYRENTYTVCAVQGELDSVGENDAFQVQKQENAVHLLQVVIDRDDSTKNYKTHLFSINRQFIMSASSNGTEVCFISYKQGEINLEAFKFDQDNVSEETVLPLFAVSLPNIYNYNEIILLKQEVAATFVFVASFQGYVALFSINHKSETERSITCVPVLNFGKTKAGKDFGYIDNIQHIPGKNLIFLQSRLALMKVGYACQKGVASLELEQIVKQFKEPIERALIDGKFMYTCRKVLHPKPKLQFVYTFLKEVSDQDEEDEVELQINVLE